MDSDARPGRRGRNARCRDTSRAAGGLRMFSLKVVEKIRSHARTTYNAVATELVIDQGGARDGKSIRRRCYDAINVLLACGLIKRDERKQIVWRGHGSVELDRLRSEVEAKRQAVERKRATLQELERKHKALEALLERSAQRSSSDTPDSGSGSAAGGAAAVDSASACSKASPNQGPTGAGRRITLPFFLVQAGADVSYTHSNDHMNVEFQLAERPLQLHDDSSVLLQLHQYQTGRLGNVQLPLQQQQHPPAAPEKQQLQRKEHPDQAEHHHRRQDSWRDAQPGCSAQPPMSDVRTAAPQPASAFAPAAAVPTPPGRHLPETQPQLEERPPSPPPPLQQQPYAQDSLTPPQPQFGLSHQQQQQERHPQEHHQGAFFNPLQPMLGMLPPQDPSQCLVLPPTLLGPGNEPLPANGTTSSNGGDLPPLTLPPMPLKQEPHPDGSLVSPVGPCWSLAVPAQQRPREPPVPSLSPLNLPPLNLPPLNLPPRPRLPFQLAEDLGAHFLGCGGGSSVGHPHQPHARQAQPVTMQQPQSQAPAGGSMGELFPSHNPHQPYHLGDGFGSGLLSDSLAGGQCDPFSLPQGEQQQELLSQQHPYHLYHQQPQPYQQEQPYPQQQQQLSQYPHHHQHDEQGQQHSHNQPLQPQQDDPAAAAGVGAQHDALLSLEQMLDEEDLPPLSQLLPLGAEANDPLGFGLGSATAAADQLGYMGWPYSMSPHPDPLSPSSWWFQCRPDTARHPLPVTVGVQQ